MPIGSRGRASYLLLSIHPRTGQVRMMSGTVVVGILLGLGRINLQQMLQQRHAHKIQDTCSTTLSRSDWQGEGWTRYSSSVSSPPSHHAYLGLERVSPAPTAAATYSESDSRLVVARGIVCAHASGLCRYTRLLTLLSRAVSCATCALAVTDSCMCFVDL